MRAVSGLLPVLVLVACCASTATVSAGAQRGEQCPADITLDGIVNRADLEFLLILWNHFGTDADINNDLIVDVFDLLELLASWGSCDAP